MRAQSEILNDLHQRLVTLAGLQGEESVSFDFVKSKVRDFEYKCLDEWLQTAPSPNSSEYAAMREAHIAQVVADNLKPIVLPSRHAQQTVEHTDKDWTGAFNKVSKQLAEHEDAMLALLGSRGTGKTQMAVELIRYMAIHRVESATMPIQNLERWAWSYYSSPVKVEFARYSNTMDFFLQLRKTYQPNSDEHENDVLQRYIAPSLLILDETHDRRESDWENQMFTYLVDRRYQSATKQTVFIANQTAEQFAASVGPSIADRIHECGGIVECNWKSFRGE